MTDEAITRVYHATEVSWSSPQKKYLVLQKLLMFGDISYCLDQSSKKLNKRSAWLGLVACKLNFSILLFLSWSCPSLKCKRKNASSVCFLLLVRRVNYQAPASMLTDLCNNRLSLYCGADVQIFCCCNCRVSASCSSLSVPLLHLHL